MRPLAAPKNNADGAKTKEISRSHKLIVSKTGLITITGGKWTTYRKMAEETVNIAIRSKGLAFHKCHTKSLRIHGYRENSNGNAWISIYGSDENEILNLYKEVPSFSEKLHPDFDFTAGEVVWAVRMEMARTIDDVLARRVRALYLDAKASLSMAPGVASLMAKELRKDKAWEEAQVKEYTQLAASYIIS